MRCVYLIGCQMWGGYGVKIGYAKDFRRFSAYYTHNPTAKLFQTVAVYAKTKHHLERQLHKEMANLGFRRIQAEDGRITEWFFIPYNKGKTFLEQGFAQFEACKGRKITHYMNGKAVHPARVDS